MKTSFLLENNKLDKKTLIANKPLKTLFMDMDEGDEEEDADSQWLAKARRLQARRWRKIKHQTS